MRHLAVLVLALAACGQSHTYTINLESDAGPAAAGHHGSGGDGGDSHPLALVYRGPAECDGCAEAVAAVLVSSQWNFDVEYVGPNEDMQVSTDLLAQAALYVQPGGHINLWDAFDSLSDDAPMVASYVHGGGRYLGFCEGGYLAGMNPGYQLLPGDSNSYITSPNATVTDTHDTVIKVSWRGVDRWMYFQDGPIFIIAQGSPNVTTLATYDNGTIAALTTPYGNGKVGVVGTYPEAPQSWYDTYGVVDPDGPDADLAHDLIDAVMQ